MKQQKTKRLKIKQTATRFNKKPEATVSATTVTTASPKATAPIAKPQPTPTKPLEVETPTVSASEVSEILKPHPFIHALKHTLLYAKAEGIDLQTIIDLYNDIKVEMPMSIEECHAKQSGSTLDLDDYNDDDFLPPPPVTELPFEELPFEPNKPGEVTVVKPTEVTVGKEQKEEKEFDWNAALIHNMPKSAIPVQSKALVQPLEADEIILPDSNPLEGIDLNDDQKALIQELNAFAKDANRNEFILQGAAGTGKTFIIMFWLKSRYDVKMLLTPTHKAKGVMQMKGVQFGFNADNVTTIHSYAYDFSMGQDGEGYKFIPKAPPTDGGEFVIVDETSMVSFEQVSQLRKFTSKRIWIGDINQLPPVGDEKNLDNLPLSTPTFELTEIVRNGGAIVKLAHSLLGSKTKGDLIDNLLVPQSRKSNVVHRMKSNSKGSGALDRFFDYLDSSVESAFWCVYANRSADYYNTLAQAHLAKKLKTKGYYEIPLIKVQGGQFALKDGTSLNFSHQEVVLAKVVLNDKGEPIYHGFTYNGCYYEAESFFAPIQEVTWEQKKTFSGGRVSPVKRYTEYYRKNMNESPNLDETIYDPSYKYFIDSKDFGAYFGFDNTFSLYLAGTTHSSQGSEWDYVFIDMWMYAPKKTETKSIEQVRAEEVDETLVKHAYTSVTRARKELVIGHRYASTLPGSRRKQGAKNGEKTVAPIKGVILGDLKK